MKVEPYLSFEGRAEEAIEFYKKAVGAEVLMLMRFKDAPPPSPSDPPPPTGCGKLTPGTENNVMHATLQIGGSMMHVSDGRSQGNPKFEGISLSLSVDTEAQADKAFAALGDGGTPFMPLAKTFFASKFGMVQDRFGVVWMVIAEK